MPSHTPSVNKSNFDNFEMTLTYRYFEISVFSVLSSLMTIYRVKFINKSTIILR